MKMSNKSMTQVTLTQDQQKAINGFLDFLVSDDHFFAIQGAAGTGKSFLIHHLLETFYSKYKAYCLFLQRDVKKFDIRITATTNKAVSVIGEFLGPLLIKRPDIKVNTIYSLLGLKVVNDHKTGKTTLSFSQTNGASSFIPEHDKIPLVFIDESSFVNEELQEIIDTILHQQWKAKIIYIGDRYQLAPVGQSYSVLDSIKCQSVELIEIVRNQGAILTLGDQFRQTVANGIFRPITYNGVDVVHVKGPEFKRLVDQAYSCAKWHPSTSRILAWTNERVQEYNLYVRKLLKLPEQFQVGETVVTNEFIKSPTSFSRSVDSEVEITAIHQQKTDMYGVPGYMVEIDGSYVSFMPEKFQDAKQLMKELAAKKEWKRYFEIKETWFDLRAVYASSVHKSQGSTYDTVFLDLTDIGKNWQANDVARLMYVGITRAAKKVVCYGFLPDRYC